MFSFDITILNFVPLFLSLSMLRGPIQYPLNSAQYIYNYPIPNGTVRNRLSYLQKDADAKTGRYIFWTSGRCTPFLALKPDSCGADIDPRDCCWPYWPILAFEWRWRRDLRGSGEETRRPKPNQTVCASRTAACGCCGWPGGAGSGPASETGEVGPVAFFKRVFG